MTEDTIAAIATGLGGGISILRLSGPDSTDVLNRVWAGRSPVSTPRALVYGRLHAVDGETLDRGLAVFMPAPNSYTGEDVVELHVHGGGWVARRVLNALLASGARHAEPGEYTKRAFINGKMDLTQAEAVADIIAAGSDMALHAAQRQLDGVLGCKVAQVLDALTEVLAETESRMDFVDEDLNWQSIDAMSASLETALSVINGLIRSRRDGEVLRHGIRMALVGAPNAGKSSLLNAILGRDRAIVSHLPGTTRDSLEENVTIRGIPVVISDTAGLRETDCPVEQEGVARSYDLMRGSRLVIRVLDATQPLDAQPLEGVIDDGMVICVANKTDICTEHRFSEMLGCPVISISAIDGTGLDALYDAIEQAVWDAPNHAEPDVAVNARHAELLSDARTTISDALTILPEEEFELIAINLRSAIDAVGAIVGKTVQPDILDHIFSNFCIGK